MDEICKHCSSRDIIKKGIKKKKLRNIQKYRCKACKKTFMQEENTTYQIPTIIKAVSFYNKGYTLEQTKNIMENITKTRISKSTISYWIRKYTTYHKLRKKAKQLYKPKETIAKQQLQHKQVYSYKFHKAKLKLLPELNKNIPSNIIDKLIKYLNKIQTDNFLITYSIIIQKKQEALN